MTETLVQPSQDALMRGVLPYIQVEGAVEAVAFYKRAFGAEELSRAGTDDGKKLMNAQLKINGGVIMVMDAMPEHGHPFQPSPSLTLQLIVPDAQGWFDRAVAAGCSVGTPVQKMFWGDLWGSVTDPYQYNWAFNQLAEAAPP